jgi:thioredoxin-like negative regulator of GroEL
MVTGVFGISGDVAFTVLGAVAVSAFTGWLTAYTTNRRLNKQLASEEARQAAQLRHERELSDLAELRRLLDETSQLVSQAVKTSAGVAADWIKQTESGLAKTHLEKNREELRNQAAALIAYQQRIMLRLPRDSAVTQALEGVRSKIWNLHELSGRPLINEVEAQYMNQGKGGSDVIAAQFAFLDASRDLVGAQLPSTNQLPQKS